MLLRKTGENCALRQFLVLKFLVTKKLEQFLKFQELMKISKKNHFRKYSFEGLYGFFFVPTKKAVRVCEGLKTVQIVGIDYSKS